jgi:antirestriction protein ArdC
MEEKNQQEKMAAARQVELFENAFNKAKENGGIWLDNDGRKAPKLYLKPLQISAFNAIILGMHSDQNGYKTNQYTLFSEAKKRGESVQTKEKGVPFLWYNWNEYINKHNPDEKISRSEYQSLSADKQEDYRGIRNREVRSLFNIEQTTLPMVDKATFDTVVKETGPLKDRTDVESASNEIRQGVENLLEQSRKNLVEIRTDATGVAHYDSRKDIVFLPPVSSYEYYEDYARDAISMLMSATGHQQRLAREGLVVRNGKTSEDAMKQERLVVEVASAVKLQELGISAKLSPDSIKMTDYWLRELKEDPHLPDILERDVNNAIDMLHKAERGEKVELNNRVLQNQIADIKHILPKHYYVADEIKTLPNIDTKEFVVVKEPEQKMADVVLPAGASLGIENEIQGMNKGRIEHALQKEGYDTVTFYNIDGSMGYRPDDSFFDGKEVSVNRMNKWNMETLTLLDVSDAVKRSRTVDFEKILMLRDDEGKWALYLKPENEKGFSVYPDKADLNFFFTTIKQGDEETSEKVRQDMAQKYYMTAQNNPEIKVDLFKSNATAEDIEKIDRVNIYKTRGSENQASAILCMPTINGEKLKPREVSPQQWQRMWLAEDMQDYKKHLAASLFADVLRKDRTNAVAVGTDKSEQEVQSNDNGQQTEVNEEKSEENTRQTDSQATSESNGKGINEKKNKDESSKAKETAELSPMLKQFYELKSKHPDAIMLFRCGDFYETYSKDAEKAAKILGITLSKSNHTKDAEGKPLMIAGVPHHALDVYLPKLIRAGERVAICDQMETPRQEKNVNEKQISELVKQEESQSSRMHR